MPKQCTECTKYPMCEAYQEIRRIIEKHSIFSSTRNIFISVASACKYFIDCDMVLDED